MDEILKEWLDFTKDTIILNHNLDDKLEALRHKTQEAIKAIPMDAEVIVPSITVDSEAIRFDFGHTGVNLFWRDLFIGQRTPSFQTEVMENLLKMYNEHLIARSE